MSFGREKRLLLGWLAALAPLPLPFNGLLEWSFLMAYWMAVAIFLFRASQGREEWLPTWALNVIGLAYLPVLYLDFTRFWSGQVLRPLLHLAAFALVTKLFALQREREKWQVFVGIFFLFLASMGTSVHPLALLYLVVFLTLSVATLMRFAALHFLTSFRQPVSVLAGACTKRFLAVSTLVTLGVATLLFPLLPRIGTPYLVAGAGSGGRQRAPSSGFSNVMTLDGIGRIRTSTEVALRIEYESQPPMRHELRYKGATYDLFQGSSWRQSPLQEKRLRRGPFDYFHLQEGDPHSWVTVWQEPMGVRNFFLPVETVAMDVDARDLAVDEGGAVFFRRRSLRVLEYRLALGEGVSSIAPIPSDETVGLDQAGVSLRLTALAARVMGEGPLLERIERLEQHLVQKYEYTLDLLGRGGSNPIESFLFEDKRGHCEYFASSMVLMLRSQGIPARLVTGFLGGERNAIEGYYVVRQSNAHAWVEAYIPESGWKVFEPTPPSGRPTMGSGSKWSTILQAYDYVVFRWDRYILTFGAADQVSLFSSLRDAWDGLRKMLFGEPGSESTVARPSPGDLGMGSSRSDRSGGPAALRGWWLFALPAMALAIALWAWWRRPAFDATQAYRLLRRRARRRGLDIPESMAPVELVERLERTWPELAESAGPIVWRYLEESFGARAVDETEVGILRERLRRASEGMKKAA